MPSEIKPLFSKEAEKQVELLAYQFNELLEVVEVLSKKQINLSTNSFKEATKAQKALTDEQKEAEKIAKQLEAARKKLVFAQSEEGKELITIRTEIAAVNREIKASLSPYAEYSNQVKKAKDTAKSTLR